MSAVEKTVPTVDANNGDSGTSSLVKESYGHVHERITFGLALQRRTWWKVDLHIMTVAVLLYLAEYIDRANIGNARVLGMQAELHLTSGQYNWAREYPTVLFLQVLIKITLTKTGRTFYIALYQHRLTKSPLRSLQKISARRMQSESPIGALRT
ncbi:hypothetical protein BKA62DRAFT_773531 [Auriculariales sp. MPI-PUGE-AT-0066]|nr:hypothetical protein BKA62DRAFT_773531 [Auriculariales sp. MPI-PUGE-AT-0066]